MCVCVEGEEICRASALFCGWVAAEALEAVAHTAVSSPCANCAALHTHAGQRCERRVCGSAQAVGGRVRRGDGGVGGAEGKALRPHAAGPPSPAGKAGVLAPTRERIGTGEYGIDTRPM